MNFKNKKYFRYLIILSPLVLFFIFIKSNFLFSFFHELVNIFAGGRSSTKVLAYLGYIFLLLIITYFIKYQKINFSVKKKLFFLFLLIGAYLVNFLSYLYFLLKYKFAYQDYVLVFNSQEISSTYLFHNHTLKSIIAWILQFFHISYLENIDAGTAFLNLIPNIFIISGLILFLLTLFFFIYYFFYSVQIRTEHKLAYTILYSILSFSLLKNIIDGGFFNYEALISFSFFILLLFYEKKYFRKITISLLVSYLGFNIILYFLNFFKDFNYFIHNIYLDLVYILLLFLFFYFLQENKRQKTLILLIILEISLALFYFHSFISMQSYRNLEILPEDGALVATYNISDQADYNFYAALNGLSFYEIKPSEKMKVQDVLTELDLLDNFYPVNVFWKTCNPRGRYNSYSFNLLIDQEITVHNFDKLLIFSHFDLLSEKLTGMYEYQVELNINPCIPRPINVIGETFKSLGLKTFFITNLTQEKSGAIIN